jgi:hypothetical protein
VLCVLHWLRPQLAPLISVKNPCHSPASSLAALPPHDVTLAAPGRPPYAPAKGAGVNDRTPQSAPLHGASHEHVPDCTMHFPFSEQLSSVVQPARTPPLLPVSSSSSDSSSDMRHGGGARPPAAAPGGRTAPKAERQGQPTARKLHTPCC